MAYYDDWPVYGGQHRIEAIGHAKDGKGRVLHGRLSLESKKWKLPRQQRLFEQYEEYLLRYTFKERYETRGRQFLESRLLRPGCGYEHSVEPNRQPLTYTEFARKALSLSVVAGWAYAAGISPAGLMRYLTLSSRWQHLNLDFRIERVGRILVFAFSPWRWRAKAAATDHVLSDAARQTVAVAPGHPSCLNLGQLKHLLITLGI